MTRHEQLGWTVPVLDENGQPTTYPASDLDHQGLFMPDPSQPPTPGHMGVLTSVDMYGVEYSQGTLAIGVVAPEQAVSKPGWYRQAYNITQPVFAGWGTHGFAWHWAPADSRLVFMTWRRELMLPFWFVVVVLLTFPIGVLLHGIHRWRGQRQHVSAGHCVVCNFDLRATPERCPECGTVGSLQATAGRSPIRRDWTFLSGYW